jgi:hypothetical protein
MHRPDFLHASAALCLLAPALPANADDPAGANEPAHLSEVTVRARRVANTRPAGSYPSLATALRFDPQTELQSRGLPEGQADVTVRGGLFENTGFAVGAMTVMDPQTGHYAAELPLDPADLSPPQILTGIDNALSGFNSSIATVAYAIPILADGAGISFGAGSDGLRFQALRLAGRSGDLAGAMSAASSRGDGSQPNGDHDFQRYNLHVQRANDDAQTDLIFAYQDKFYGWPGAYTGFATLPETDFTQTTLLFANHRKRVGDGWIEVGAVHRRLEDDYDFDRTTQESGAPGSFDHETRMNAIGFQGLYRGGRVDWRYGGQLTADELVRSTDLVSGDFARRRYVKLGVVPSMDILQAEDRTVSLRAGVTFDDSNRDDNAVSPLIGVTFRQDGRFVDFEYAATSQLPGYTALKSPPSGLFGGNPDLGREKSGQWLLSVGQEALTWDAKAALFYRREDGLIDWTYLAGAPFLRQANAVDLNVTGAEVRFSRRWADVGFAAGYQWLDKDGDYGAALVDASFYALNYARHRATLAATWQWTERLEWRLDSEYRVNEDDPLRTSADHALLVSLALVWEAPDGEGPGLALTVDNLTDSDFEPFPGTPAVGRQISLRASYGW